MFPGGSAGSSIVTAAAQVTAVALVRSLTQKLLPAKGMAKKKKKKKVELWVVWAVVTRRQDPLPAS